MAVSAQDIVNSAYKLLGAQYRIWELGDSIPMWVDDNAGDPPPDSHLQSVGVECSDLINFALGDNGLPSGGGTQAFADYLVDTSDFDPNTAGQAGAIAFCPYTGPDLGQQGHIALYVNEHTLIQALVRSGVTDAYTDTETWGWGGDTAFTVYGFLPSVDYSGGPAPVVTPIAVGGPKWIAIGARGALVAEGSDYSLGWYDTGYRRGDWSFHGPGQS